MRVVMVLFTVIVGVLFASPAHAGPDVKLTIEHTPAKPVEQSGYTLKLTAVNQADLPGEFSITEAPDSTNGCLQEFGMLEPGEAATITCTGWAPPAGTHILPFRISGIMVDAARITRLVPHTLTTITSPSASGSGSPAMTGASRGALPLTGTPTVPLVLAAATLLSIGAGTALLSGRRDA